MTRVRSDRLARSSSVCFNLTADPHDYDRRMEQLCADVLPEPRAVGGLPGPDTPAAEDAQGARGIVDGRYEQ
jgi:hypothetical protein